MDWGGCATGRATARLGNHHSQHDELARAELVAQRHDRALVIAHAHGEHVNAGVVDADRRRRGETPQSDRAIARSRHDDVVVVGNRTAPDLY